MSKDGEVETWDIELDQVGWWRVKLEWVVGCWAYARGRYCNVICEVGKWGSKHFLIFFWYVYIRVHRSFDLHLRNESPDDAMICNFMFH
jgi:hypothetical protein